jgi:hypothetical protein
MHRPRQFCAAVVVVLAGIALVISLPSPATASHKSAIQFTPCPKVKKKERQEAGADRNPRASEATVPMTPRAVQICRYFGLGFHQTPKTLARSGKLRDEVLISSAAAVRSLAQGFNSLQKFPEGPIYCPSDEGSRLYGVFGYASATEPQVPVEVDLSGCPYVWNGRTPHAYWMGPGLHRRLLALTKGKGDGRPATNPTGG